MHSGNTLFTLLGFMGLYTLLAILFIFLITREISRGPTQESDLSVTDGTPVSLA